MSISNLHYQIINIEGKEVGNGSLKKGLNTIAMEYLSNGLFLVQVRNKSTGEQIIKKIAKY